MSTVLGLKLTSTASEWPVLQHSCGSGQRGPADPAGEVGWERTRSSLPLPAGRKKRQAFQERRRRAQLPGRPKARRVSCSSCSAAHKAPVPRHPERRTLSAASLAPLRPGLTRGPKPGTVLTRQFLSSSFANKQHGLSPRVLAQEVPPCTEQSDGCGHLLPVCLGDNRSIRATCFLLPACSNADLLPSPAPCFPACLSFP